MINTAPGASIVQPGYCTLQPKSREPGCSHGKCAEKTLRPSTTFSEQLSTAAKAR